LNNITNKAKKVSSIALSSVLLSSSTLTGYKIEIPQVFDNKGLSLKNNFPVSDRRLISKSRGGLKSDADLFRDGLGSFTFTFTGNAPLVDNSAFTMLVNKFSSDLKTQSLNDFVTDKSDDFFTDIDKLLMDEIPISVRTDMNTVAGVRGVYGSHDQQVKDKRGKVYKQVEDNNGNICYKKDTTLIHISGKEIPQNVLPKGRTCEDEDLFYDTQTINITSLDQITKDLGKGYRVKVKSDGINGRILTNCGLYWSDKCSSVENETVAFTINSETTFKKSKTNLNRVLISRKTSQVKTYPYVPNNKYYEWFTSHNKIQAPIDKKNGYYAYYDNLNSFAIYLNHNLYIKEGNFYVNRSTKNKLNLPIPENKENFIEATYDGLNDSFVKIDNNYFIKEVNGFYPLNANVARIRQNDHVDKVNDATIAYYNNKEAEKKYIKVENKVYKKINKDFVLVRNNEVKLEKPLYSNVDLYNTYFNKDSFESNLNQYISYNDKIFTKNKNVYKEINTNTILEIPLADVKDNILNAYYDEEESKFIKIGKEYFVKRKDGYILVDGNKIESNLVEERKDETYAYYLNNKPSHLKINGKVYTKASNGKYLGTSDNKELIDPSYVNIKDIYNMYYNVSSEETNLNQYLMTDNKVKELVNGKYIDINDKSEYLKPIAIEKDNILNAYYDEKESKFIKVENEYFVQREFNGVKGYAKVDTLNIEPSDVTERKDSTYAYYLNDKQNHIKVNGKVYTKASNGKYLGTSDNKELIDPLYVNIKDMYNMYYNVNAEEDNLKPYLMTDNKVKELVKGKYIDINDKSEYKKPIATQKDSILNAYYDEKNSKFIKVGEEYFVEREVQGVKGYAKVDTIDLESNLVEERKDETYAYYLNDKPNHIKVNGKVYTKDKENKYLGTSDNKELIDPLYVNIKDIYNMYYNVNAEEDNLKPYLMTDNKVKELVNGKYIDINDKSEYLKPTATPKDSILNAYYDEKESKFIKVGNEYLVKREKGYVKVDGKNIESAKVKNRKDATYAYYLNEKPNHIKVNGKVYTKASNGKYLGTSDNKELIDPLYVNIKDIYNMYYNVSSEETNLNQYLMTDNKVKELVKGKYIDINDKSEYLKPIATSKDSILDAYYDEKSNKFIKVENEYFVKREKGYVKVDGSKIESPIVTTRADATYAYYLSSKPYNIKIGSKVYSLKDGVYKETNSGTALVKPSYAKLDIYNMYYDETKVSTNLNKYVNIEGKIKELKDKEYKDINTGTILAIPKAKEKATILDAYYDNKDSKLVKVGSKYFVKRTDGYVKVDGSKVESKSVTSRDNAIYAYYLKNKPLNIKIGSKVYSFKDSKYSETSNTEKILSKPTSVDKGSMIDAYNDGKSSTTVKISNIYYTKETNGKIEEYRKLEDKRFVSSPTNITTRVDATYAYYLSSKPYNIKIGSKVYSLKDGVYEETNGGTELVKPSYTNQTSFDIYNGYYKSTGLDKTISKYIKYKKNIMELKSNIYTDINDNKNIISLPSAAESKLSVLNAYYDEKESKFIKVGNEYFVKRTDGYVKVDGETIISKTLVERKDATYAYYKTEKPFNIYLKSLDGVFYKENGKYKSVTGGSYLGKPVFSEAKKNLFTNEQSLFYNGKEEIKEDKEVKQISINNKYYEKTTGKDEYININNENDKITKITVTVKPNKYVAYNDTKETKIISIDKSNYSLESGSYMKFTELGVSSTSLVNNEAKEISHDLAYAYTTKEPFIEVDSKKYYYSSSTSEYINVKDKSNKLSKINYIVRTNNIYAYYGTDTNNDGKDYSSERETYINISQHLYKYNGSEYIKLGYYDEDNNFIKSTTTIQLGKPTFETVSSKEEAFYNDELVAEVVYINNDDGRGTYIREK
jgi:hypothetical protein